VKVVGSNFKEKVLHSSTDFVLTLHQGDCSNLHALQMLARLCSCPGKVAFGAVNGFMNDIPLPQLMLDYEAASSPTYFGHLFASTTQPSSIWYFHAHDTQHPVRFKVRGCTRVVIYSG
jgi:hypothetical protein